MEVTAAIVVAVTSLVLAIPAFLLVWRSIKVAIEQDRTVKITYKVPLSIGIEINQSQQSEQTKPEWLAQVPTRGSGACIGAGVGRCSAIRPGATRGSDPPGIVEIDRPERHRQLVLEVDPMEG